MSRHSTLTSRDYAQTNVQLYEQLWKAGYSLEDVHKLKDAYSLAQQLFSSEFRGSGRPFLAHLVGTASILVKHGATRDVVVAGLLHAAYEFGNFGHGLRRVNNRKRQMLINIVGSDIEAIIHGYGSSKRQIVQEEVVALVTEDVSTLTRATFLIRLANELEDALGDNYDYSGTGKRSHLKSSLPRYIELAMALGHLQLADELGYCLGSIEHRSTQEGLQGVTASYTIAPLSHRQRTHLWLIDIARTCRNAWTKHQPADPQKKD